MEAIIFLSIIIALFSIFISYLVIRRVKKQIVAFREKPKSFSHKLQKSTTFCKLAKNKRAFERYFISYQTPFYLFIIMAHPVCIPVYLKYHNSMPYKFGQDDSG